MRGFSCPFKMETSLLSTVPLLLVFGALVYATFVGEKSYTSTGCISILAIAVTLFGLIVGWLLQRFLPSPRSVDDVVIYRSMRLEVALLFFCVTGITLLAVSVVKKDTLGGSKAAPGHRRLTLLLPFFAFAVSVAARGKIAAFLIALLANVNP
jgi:hypothetical protein